MFGKNTVEISTISNGIRVATDAMNDVSTVSVFIMVGVGSRYEDKRVNGISHFLEHMAFKGTTSRTALQIVEEVEGVGGSMNAFTGRENTAYYIRAMAENLELMATVSDVARPLLDAGRIAWFCLAVTLYGRGGEFSRPWLACWVSARFERKIRRLVERPFRDAIQHHRGLVNEAVQKSSQLAPGCDSQWYHTAMLIDNHGSKCKIRASRHANEFAELGKRQHVKAERAVRAWEENWIQDGLFRRWPDSFADRIAESRGVRGLLCAGPVALALIIGGASLAHGPLTWVLILCVLLILFASLAWRTCRICTKISAKIWRRGKITCPICHRASVVETFPGEATVDCPACGANNVRVNFRKSQM